MILKLIIKNNNWSKNKKIIVWIQKHEAFKEDLTQIFQFFKNNIKISEKRRFYKFYKITSKNPAIMMSLFSAVHELIPEVYFNSEDSIGKEEFLDIENP